MKLGTSKSVIAVVALWAATLGSPRAARAQWVVHDPINWVSLGSIWGQQVSTGVKIAEEVQQGIKMYQNAVQLYGVASQEASYFRNKQVLLAVGFLAQHAAIPGQPGWDQALTKVSGIANAASVWQQMTAPGGSLLNRIKLADSFAASAVNSIGSCSQAATQNNGSIGSLEVFGIDLNPSSNTRSSQANIGNMAATQQLRTQQCQQNLQIQQAQMELLRVHAQREQDQYLLDRQTNTAAVMGQLQTTNTVNAIKNVVDR